MSQRALVCAAYQLSRVESANLPELPLTFSGKFDNFDDDRRA